MDAPIYQGIKQYLSKNRTSFHMPGHKGNGDWKPTDFYALDAKCWDYRSDPLRPAKSVCRI